MIRQMSAEKAIVLSTHILDEMEAVCTRAIIISQGRIVADETPEQLRSRSLVHGALSVTLPPSDPEKILACIRQVSGVRETRIVEQSDKALRIRVFPESASPVADRVITALSAEKYEIRDIFIELV